MFPEPPQLEVNIKKGILNYTAKCPMFPKCSGTARTVEEALKKLSDSISRMVGKTAKNTFDKIFSSTQFKEVVLDVSKKDKEHSRIFSLSSIEEELDPQKGFSVKIKPSFDSLIDNLGGALNNPNQIDFGHDINQLFGQEAFPGSHHNTRTARRSQNLFVAFGHPLDGNTFGIPINFN